MILYAYTALDASGCLHHLEDFFPSKEALEQSLVPQQMQLLSAKKIDHASKQKGLRHKDALMMLKTLSLLIESGFSLLQSFDHLLKDTQKSSLKRCFLSMVIALKKGKPLDAVIAEYSSFPVYVHCMIRLGLQSGSLGASLEQAYDLMAKEHERNQKLKRAGMYPLMLLGLFFAMMIVFTQMLLPQISLYLSELGVKELPLMTRALMTSAYFLEMHGVILITLFAVTLLLIGLFPRFSFLQNLLTPLVLKCPGMGEVMRVRFQNHWLFYVERLYGAGLDFKSALDFAASTTPNAYIKEILKHAHQSIFEGKPMIEALRGTCIFSPLTLSLIQAGAESGHLIESCAQAYQMEDQKHQDHVEFALKSLEPTLLVMMGLFLLWIVMAVITPIYDHLIL